MSLQLLVVDDEANQRRLLADYLTECGHAVQEAEAAEEALDVLADGALDAVLTDVCLPGADGVELIRRARADGTAIPFVVMTAFGSIDNAVDAMRAGARHYLTKPIRLDDLDATLAEIERDRDTPPPVTNPPPSAASTAPDDPFAGMGAAMQSVVQIMARVAPSDATVLIAGESGVGKEVVADRIHGLSKRAAQPFVKINCASLPEPLLESELFGHEKGAFTGANEARAGLFEAAHNGTIFLDEIGDISPALQVRLLRVLQEREVLRLGARQPIATNFRLLAATHRDLEKEVEAGRFRGDLLYRLRVIEIGVPPLRERPEDIGVLARILLARVATRNNVAPRPLSDGALAALTCHELPGNVRQLEHMLERALILGQGSELSRKDFPDLTPRTEGEDALPTTMREAVVALEKTWIRRALDEAGGVRAHAARRLGLPERVLRYKLAKYGMASERRK